MYCNLPYETCLGSRVRRVSTTSAETELILTIHAVTSMRHYLTQDLTVVVRKFVLININLHFFET